LAPFATDGVIKEIVERSPSESTITADVRRGCLSRKHSGAVIALWIAPRPCHCVIEESITVVAP
jgi:hypothetical protein